MLWFTAGMETDIPLLGDNDNFDKTGFHICELITFLMVDLTFVTQPPSMDILLSFSS